MLKKTPDDMPIRGMAMKIVQLDDQLVLVLILALGSFIKCYVSQPNASDRTVSSIIMHCIFTHFPSRV